MEKVSQSGAGGGKEVSSGSAATGAQLHILDKHNGVVWYGAFSMDGRRLVTATESNLVTLWDAETGKELSVLRGHKGTVFHAEFSPDGQYILSASADGTVRIWSILPFGQKLIDYAREIVHRELSHAEKEQFFLSED